MGCFRSRAGVLITPLGRNVRAEREIAGTDSEIDNVVYELYGITEEERKIIESE